MRVQDVMTKAVQTVSPATSAEDAWNLMRTRGIHHLVVTESGQVVGVLSDRDMGGRQGTSVRRDREVADLMTRHVITAEPAMPVRKAANLMRGRSIGCLVVARGRRVAGIVTTSDLLELLGRGIDRSAVTTTRPIIRHRSPHRKRHQAAGSW
jgi:acetoin utilization protein AcuB